MNIFENNDIFKIILQYFTIKDLNGIYLSSKFNNKLIDNLDKNFIINNFIDNEFVIFTKYIINNSKDSENIVERKILNFYFKYLDYNTISNFRVLKNIYNFINLLNIYPPEFIIIFGINNLFSLPILHDTNNIVGSTGYIDKIYNLSYPIMKGKDIYGREFIAFRLLNKINNNITIEVIFQRFKNNYFKWVMNGNGYIGKKFGCSFNEQIFSFIENIISNKLNKNFIII